MLFCFISKLYLIVRSDDFNTNGMKSGFAGGIKIHLSKGKFQAHIQPPLVCFLFVAMCLYATCACNTVAHNTVGIKLSQTSFKNLFFSLLNDSISVFYLMSVESAFFSLDG